METAFFSFLVRAQVNVWRRASTPEERRLYMLLVDSELPVVLRAQAEFARIVREHMERERK